MEILMPSGSEPLQPGADGEIAVEAPLPLSRSRRGNQRLAVLTVLGAGLTMLLTALLSAALLSDAGALSVGLTAVAGTFAVGVGSAAVAEVARPRLVGVIALLTGLTCVISAVIPEAFTAPELVRLVAGVAMVIASLVLLPRESGVAPAVRI
jgi:hypothetical protein